MGISFLEYAAAMVGCYTALQPHERENLRAWEAEYIDESGKYRTSDWPGWEKYIGRFQPTEPGRKETFGYVYLIQSDSGHCKIGSSLSVSNRVRQLQCASPGPLTLLYQFPSANAQQIEFALHNKFAHKRARGEWFTLDSADIVSICAVGRQLMTKN